MSAQELTAAERDVIARFDAAPALPESWEQRAAVVAGTVDVDVDRPVRRSVTVTVPDPRFRDQLAEALTQLDYRDLPLGYARDVLARATKTPGSFVSLADALMPVIAVEVEARTRTAAAQKAAEELEAAADRLTDRVRTWVLNDLRDRADTLAQPDGQQP